MNKALKALDRLLPKPLKLLIGGGSAMLLAHGFPVSTHDIDGLPLSSELTPAEIDPLVKKVARQLGISPQWYNDYFNTFTYSLPKNFRDSVVEVFKGNKLTAVALGKDELLIMKCFAGREKDIGHARALIRKGADIDRVEGHLNALKEKGLPGANAALQFLTDLTDELESSA